MVKYAEIKLQKIDENSILDRIVLKITIFVVFAFHLYHWNNKKIDENSLFNNIKQISNQCKKRI